MSALALVAPQSNTLFCSQGSMTDGSEQYNSEEEAEQLEKEGLLDLAWERQQAKVSLGTLQGGPG